MRISDFEILNIFKIEVGYKKSDPKMTKIMTKNEKKFDPTWKKSFQFFFKKLTGYVQLMIVAFDCGGVLFSGVIPKLIFRLILGNANLESWHMVDPLPLRKKFEKQKNSSVLNRSRRELSKTVEKMQK